MSFLWGVSSKQVYGIMGADSNISSTEASHYINELFSVKFAKEGEEFGPCVLIFDNSKVHTSAKSASNIFSHNIKSVSIPPYTPVL